MLQLHFHLLLLFCVPFFLTIRIIENKIRLSEPTFIPLEIVCFLNTLMHYFFKTDKMKGLELVLFLNVRIDFYQGLMIDKNYFLGMINLRGF
jgi:hypothetical protein